MIGTAELPDLIDVFLKQSRLLKIRFLTALALSPFFPSRFDNLASALSTSEAAPADSGSECRSAILLKVSERHHHEACIAQCRVEMSENNAKIH